MNPLDIILGILIFAAIGAEVFRGFGKALFDALTLYTGLWGASVAYAPIASSVHLGPPGSVNDGIVFGLCFGVFSVIALVISHYAYGSVLLNLGMFDKLFGVVGGIAVGLILAHGIVRTMAISSADDGGSNIVAASSLGEQVLDFDSYHQFVDTLYNLTGGPRIKPS